MAEVSFHKEIDSLRLRAGDTFYGENGAVEVPTLVLKVVHPLVPEEIWALRGPFSTGTIRC